LTTQSKIPVSTQHEYSKIQHGNAYGNEATDVGLTMRHRAKEYEYEDNAPKEFEFECTKPGFSGT
jgi:hypothetical protein